MFFFLLFAFACLLAALFLAFWRFEYVESHDLNETDWLMQMHSTMSICKRNADSDDALQLFRVDVSTLHFDYMGEQANSKAHPIVFDIVR